MLVDRLAQPGDRIVQPDKLASAQLVPLRDHELIDQTGDAGIPLRQRFGVDFRHASEVEIPACLRKQRGDLLHARGHGDKPLAPRRVVTRYQPVDRAAGKVAVVERVPRPRGVGGKVPDRAAQLVAQDCRIDLVFGRELAAVDCLELAQDLLVEG